MTFDRYHFIDDLVEIKQSASLARYLRFKFFRGRQRANKLRT